MKELIQMLSDARDSLNDYGKFKHLFSDDDAIKTLAELRETLGQIKLKVKLSTIKKVGHPKGSALEESSDSGKIVKVRPCADEFEGKTFIGIFIGECALGSSIRIDDDAIVCTWTHHNPAILIPDTGKIVYGCGSWWGVIESEKDLSDISDTDIENVWYVKALKQIAANQQG